MGTPQRRGSGPRPLLGTLAGLLAAACGPEPAEPAPARRGDPAPLRFDARLELPTAGKPEGVAVHDVDGDGRAELLVATRSPGSLHVFGRPGDEPRVVPLPDYLLGPEVVEGPGGTRVVLVSRASGELLELDPTAAAEPARRALPGTPRAFGVGPPTTAGGARRSPSRRARASSS